MAVAVALGRNALVPGLLSLLLLPVLMLLVVVLALALALMMPCSPPGSKQESGRAAPVAMDVVVALLTVADPVRDSQRTRVEDAVRPAIEDLYMYDTTPPPFARLLWTVCTDLDGHDAVGREGGAGGVPLGWR